MPGFPADAQGNLIPVLPVIYGQSKEAAVTTTTGTEMAINNTGTGAMVRVMAIGCDCFYKPGVTGMSLPSLIDGLVFAGTFLDIPMTAALTHIRMVARSGSGTGRVELLG